MIYQLSAGYDYDQSIKEYLQDYFTARRKEHQMKAPAMSRFYASRPVVGRCNPPELDADGLRKKLKTGDPVFVICEDNDPVAIMERDNVLYSGKDLVALVDKENQEKAGNVIPKAPVRAAEPGSFACLLYRMLGYKTAGYQAYERYQEEKENYQREINREQSRIVADRADENKIALEIDAVRRERLAAQNA